MQTMEFFQSLWAMEFRQPGLAERSAAENLAMIAEAGYAGVCLDPAVAEIAETRALLPLIREHNLKCMLNVFPHTVDELQPLLELAAELDASTVNIIGGVMPVSVDDAVPVAEAWLRMSEPYSFPVLFETHRDSLLNDLFYTLQLIERVPEMRLCADLSHFVVNREMRLPLREEDRAYIDTILQRADCLQGRVANREQVQIQVDFPQHAAWVGQFRRWWADGMRYWRARNAADATLIFLCELGPPPYAMTDANGAELSDRWQEAQTICSWAQAAWSEAQAGG
jgi:hypothetical protein